MVNNKNKFQNKKLESFLAIIFILFFSISLYSQNYDEKEKIRRKEAELEKMRLLAQAELKRIQKAKERRELQLKAKNFIIQGMNTQALKIINKLLKEEKSASLYYLRGEANFQLQKYYTSVDDFKNAIKLKNDHDQSRKRLMEIYLKTDKIKKAEELLKYLYGKGERDSKLLILGAVIYEKTKNYLSAFEMLRNAMPSIEKNKLRNYIIKLIEIAYKAGKFHEVEKYAQSLTGQISNDLLEMTAMSKYSLGKTDETLKILEYLNIQDGLSIQGLLFYAKILNMKGYEKYSLEILHKWINKSANPDKEEIAYFLQNLTKESSLKTAMKIAEYVPENHPSKSRLFLLKSIQNLKNDNIETSSIYIKKAIEFNPSCLKCYYIFSRVLIKQKSYREAVKMINIAISDTELEGNCYVLLGIVWEKLGNYKKAMSSYSKALKKLPDRHDLKKKIQQLEKKSQK